MAVFNFSHQYSCQRGCITFTYIKAFPVTTNAISRTYVTALVFPVQLQQISLRLIEFLRKDGEQTEGGKVGEGVHLHHAFPEGFKGDFFLCVCFCLKIESQPQTVNLP